MPSLLVLVIACVISASAASKQFQRGPTYQAGSRAFERGAFSEAAAQWQKVLDDDRKTRNTNGWVECSVSIAAAYEALGQQTRAVEILTDALEAAEKSGRRDLIVLAKSQLGSALALVRQNERGETLLRESLEMALSDQAHRLAASILNDLGNLLSTQGKIEASLSTFEQGFREARSADDQNALARLGCNSAATAARGGLPDKADQLNGEALKAVASLKSSHDKAFLLLTASETDQSITLPDPSAENRLLLRAQSSARAAFEIAEEIQDRTLTSYALGQLGQLYERDHQLDHALSLTRRAAFAAQQAQLPDALYQWQWQTGRLLKKQQKQNEAIGAYRSAVQTLQPIRHDVALGYGNAGVQLSFRQSVSPLFFELADLLLTQSDQEKDPAAVQTLLREARETVEQLKAVELEDYFQDECVNVVRSKSEALEQVDPHSAVLYLIPLADRTEILVSLGSGMHRFKAPFGGEQLVAEVREFRRNLETRTTYAYRDQAQHLYDLIIRPIRGLLLENSIDTLVFVPDGALQTIPLASLHDGKHFLIEEFAVAITPGLSLVQPRPMERKRAEVLLTGLSEPVQGFPSLEFVPNELDKIAAEYRSQKLLNDAFVTPALQKKLSSEQFSIVHIASHGQFDRDARNTFVLTYDDRLRLNQLEALIRPSQYRGKPVDLLVLSACQTAAGDDRAALGLAGVAVKAGARSVLASLWFVNDQSTAAFVSELYDQLRKEETISRAKAVQAAQRKMIADRRYRHPCYWAPYLLIGNWL